MINTVSDPDCSNWKPLSEGPHRKADVEEGEPKASGIGPAEYLRFFESTRFRISTINIAIIGLFCFAFLYSLHILSDILIPAVLSIMLYFLLSPITEKLSSWRIPRILSALLSVTLFFAPLIVVATFLAAPAAEWLTQVPTNFVSLKESMQSLLEPLETVRSASEAVEKAVNDLSPSSEKNYTPVVKLETPNLLETALQSLPKVAGSLLLSITLAFLLLVHGRRPIFRSLTWGRSFQRKRKALIAMTHIQDEIPKYLLTIVTINTSLGVICSLFFWMVGLPNPILWGAIAGLLNFVPYLGSIVTASVVTVVSLTTFDDMSLALIAPTGYVVLSSIEGQMISPLILGRRFALHPFISVMMVMLMTWLWGIPGALLAIPFLKACIILFSHLAPAKRSWRSLKDGVKYHRSGYPKVT